MYSANNPNEHGNEFNQIRMWPADTLTTAVGDPEQREDCTNFSWALDPWKFLDSKKKRLFSVIK